MKTWHNGSLIEGRAQIDSLNFSLHYSSPIAWEGIRSYRQEDGTTQIFKLREHVLRLLDTAKILNFSIPYSEAEIIEACQEVVAANGGGDLYLRPIAYANHDAELVKPKGVPVNLDIYAFPLPQLHDKPDIKMVISNLVRGYPQFQMQAKTSMNYGVLQGAVQYAKSMGADDIFLLDNQGHVVEAQVANFFVVKGDLITTPPNDGSILPGITRRSIVELLQNQVIMSKARKMPIVAEKKITKADLYTADAVFLCGTYVEVVNVVEIDGRVLPGSPYVDILKKEYRNLVQGKK